MGWRITCSQGNAKSAMERIAGMDDDYMKARAADIKDISNRLGRNLMREDETDLGAMEPAIIVADDLSPSETVWMDKKKITHRMHRGMLLKQECLTDLDIVFFLMVL